MELRRYEVFRRARQESSVRTQGLGSSNTCLQIAHQSFAWLVFGNLGTSLNKGDLQKQNPDNFSLSQYVSRFQALFRQERCISRSKPYPILSGLACFQQAFSACGRPSLEFLPAGLTGQWPEHLGSRNTTTGWGEDPHIQERGPEPRCKGQQF